MVRSLAVLRLLLCLTAFLSFALAADPSSEPDVQVTAEFPEDNPFGLVVNGVKNRILFNIENKSPNNISLVSGGGSFHDPGTETLLRNTTTSSFAGIVIPSTAKLQLPYHFNSEFRPQDLKLHLWIDYLDGANKWRAYAYDSVVTIVEPPASIFDFQLISTYLLIAAMLAGASYYAYLTFMPQKKKTRRPVSVSAPVGPVKASNSSGTYQEEWIPAHHLKKKKGDGTASGPESGAESEATRKRRSPRKRAQN